MDFLALSHTSLEEMNSSPLCPWNLDTPKEYIDQLAPLFPPPNFDVPDISFSNSVSPSADFHYSFTTSDENYSLTRIHCARRHSIEEQSKRDNHHRGGNFLETQMGRGKRCVTPFSSVSGSPQETSSSEDSEIILLAQTSTRALKFSTESNTCNRRCITSSTHSIKSADTEFPEEGPVYVSKKSKSCKRKRKKDPNEPHKPVSAYALFFRDRQAYIKGHNPGASFGEVSKIVASMWDQLQPDHKDVYKKKTELAKKQYLKQLAAYRAGQVSLSALEEAKKSPSSGCLGPSTPRDSQELATATFRVFGVGNLPGTWLAQIVKQVKFNAVNRDNPDFARKQNLCVVVEALDMWLLACDDKQAARMIRERILHQSQPLVMQMSPSPIAQLTPPPTQPNIQMTAPHIRQIPSHILQQQQQEHQQQYFLDQMGFANAPLSSLQQRSTYTSCHSPLCHSLPPHQLVDHSRHSVCQSTRADHNDLGFTVQKTVNF